MCRPLVCVCFIWFASVLFRATLWSCAAISAKLLDKVHCRIVLLRCCLLQKAGVELVAGVRAGLKQRMMDVDWLDDETRKLSIEKVTSALTI